MVISIAGNKVPETDNDWVNNYYQDTSKKD